MRTRLLVTAALAVTALAVPAAALAGDSPAATPAAAQAQTVVFTVDLVSTGTTLHTLPGDITYGWNHLVGTTRWGNKAASVEFLGSVDYTSGTGPFGGFVTFTRSDGTQLAVNATGWATSPADQSGTADATFAGSLQVIGGSGAYSGAQGSGRMTGFRKAALGSPVTLTFSITVQK